MKLQKYFGYLSYNGKFFNGSQCQRTQELSRTVQDTLKASIEKRFAKNLTNFSVRLASRTDAGVHANRNAFDFFLKFEEGSPILPTRIIKASLNGYFMIKQPDESVHFNNLYIPDVYLCENSFDSRKDAVQRKYTYKIKFNKGRLINQKEDLSDFLFTKDYYYNIDSTSEHFNLNTSKLLEIAQVIQGQFYDFTNFYKSKEVHPNPVKRIEKIDIKITPDPLSEETENIFIIFEARSFLRNQIRILVNTMLDYACDKLAKEEIVDRLLMKKIILHKHSAPAEGLYLSDIIYREEVYNLHKEIDLKLEKEYIAYKQNKTPKS